MSDPLTELRNADEVCREKNAAIAEYGEAEMNAVADAYHRATHLFDRYESRATGTGDFEAFLEFQGKFGDFVDGLPDDLPAREAFERAETSIDKRRLSERDFEKARNALTPAKEIVALSDERQAARERYRDTRHTVSQRVAELNERIASLERLRELGDADLDAPTGLLREPIDAANDAITEAFSEFTHDATSREMVEFLTATEHYPLIEFRPPPETLREYLLGRDGGDLTVPELLEYAHYSQSKLDHYVTDPAALKRAIATNETYLDRIDSEPLTIDWPPASANELRWWCEEAIRVADRFAPPETIARLREVEDLTRRDDFERLRTAAEARSELTDDERDKLASGEVEDELARLRDEREKLSDALDTYPSR
ncbi:hypothetical protein A4G99_00850 [Haladaptatus sp. R4]|uniref:DUF7118 family protein n=1 Tax=Haladaptatus sp. R4 TaxID=1679489 RepID=UPI0007B4919F|nr:hypothetical protein [Haladaptatus sp. R4]KZN25115.1 hypothetical protein A4G99_00850 [Haladaptatus sp. R4]